MFEDALQEARALDKDFARTKTIKGPLHGVPVSFKDLCESWPRVGSAGYALSL